MFFFIEMALYFYTFLWPLYCQDFQLFWTFLLVAALLGTVLRILVHKKLRGYKFKCLKMFYNLKNLEMKCNFNLSCFWIFFFSDKIISIIIKKNNLNNKIKWVNHLSNLEINLIVKVMVKVFLFSTLKITNLLEIFVALTAKSKSLILLVRWDPG